MNGDQQPDVYAQAKQDFVQHFSQIVKVLTEEEMGHPETGDAIARLKEVSTSHLLVLLCGTVWWFLSETVSRGSSVGMGRGRCGKVCPST